MIVKMKRVSLVMRSCEAEEALGELRRLGVVHVEHQQTPKGTDIASLTDDVSLVKDALAILSEKEFLDRPCIGTHKVPDDWRTIAHRIIDGHKRLDQLAEYSFNLKNRIIEWQPWGDFDPAAVATLAQKNIFVRFYQIAAKEVNNFPQGAVVEVISERAGIVYCAVITREKIDMPFKEVALPRMSLTSMGQRLMQDKRAMQDVREEIRKWTCYGDSFVNISRALESELEFHEALRGMGDAGELSYLCGYIPFDSERAILDTAKKERWAIAVSDLSPDDNVPTFIRNPRWVSCIQPLLKLLEILPGYTELDISPLFLVFFSLFFGMIIGDAGYGLVYLLVTYLVQRRFGAKIAEKRIFPLMYLLNTCAVIWGCMAGTFFGQAWLVKFGVRPLVPALNDTNFIQGFCFLVGVTHLTLAHLWRFFIQVPALTALAELGWIMILWAAFFLVKMLLLGSIFPEYGKYLIITGISLVVLFSNPRKTLLRTVGAGLGNIALSLMSSFGDIVSYVRLFAVGLAGVAIADAFNAMAQGAAGSGALGFIGAGFILVAGHLLNIVLAPMSVLVHGVRLNVLEFSGHAGVTWSGMPYNPLAERI